MSSRRERLKFLQHTVDELADEVQAANLEDDVVRLAEALRVDPTAVEPVDEAQWRHLLPGERRQYLPAYYLTLRAELIALEREGSRQPKKKRWSWLDGPAPKIVSLAVGVATLVEYGYDALHVAGILAYEGFDVASGYAKPGDPIA
jgi:hypothetical protein